MMSEKKIQRADKKPFKTLIKENWIFLAFVSLMGAIGGYATIEYSLEFVPPEAIQTAVDQVGSIEIVKIIATLQVLVYSLIFGTVGVVLSDRIGLWRKIKIEASNLFYSSLVGLIGGIIMILSDPLIFGRLKPEIMDGYATKPSLAYLIASFTYGAVFEEVLMRLFLMSLGAFILYRAFHNKEKSCPTKAIIAANITAGILFAIGHLPATIQTFGSLDTVLIIRSLLLNGTFGIVFGRLYRKYGIQYAMLAHFGAHFFSKLIWMLFI